MTQLRNTFVATILFFTLAFQSACTVEVELSELTEGEAVEIIEAALQDFAGGLTSNIEDISEQILEAVSSGALCDTLYTQSIEENYQRGQVQSSYQTELSYEMSCNSLNFPESATFTSSTDYDYSTLRITSDDDARFLGSISGLLVSDSSLVLVGNYESSGSQDLNFNSQRSVASTFTVNLTNLEVNKTEIEIITGSGDFTFTAEIQGNTSTFTGSISFMGDDSLMLTLNDNTYTFDLN
ncbi:MAG: hypothetical protein AAFR87_23710 [Bacteroidota bacterium]